MQATARHECIIYENSPADHLAHIASIVAGKLQARYRCLYLNSPSMVAGMRSYLYAAGIDVAHEVRTGSLILSSDDSHLIDGRFHVQQMIDVLADAVECALGIGYQGLWATGDMTWEFGAERNFDKLLEYERALEKLFSKQRALSGICQYHKGTLPAGALRQAIQTHSSVYLNETLNKINPFYLPPGPSPDPHAGTQPEEMRIDFACVLGHSSLSSRRHIREAATFRTLLTIGNPVSVNQLPFHLPD